MTRPAPTIYNLYTLMLMLVIAMAIAGCASGPGGASPLGQSPATVVYNAKSAYAITLRTAVAYESMPRCSATVKFPCSDTELVAQIRKADNTAIAALDAAEHAVRTTTVGDDIRSKAITAANAALAAFQAVATTLRSQ
jgi:hypothetical protein